MRQELRLVLGFVLALVFNLTPAPTDHARAVATPPTGLIAYQGIADQLQLIEAGGSDTRTIPTRGRAVNPRWSPNGQEIVYFDELAGTTTEGQLVVVNSSTSASRVLVAPELRNPTLGTYWAYLQPRWGHDGRAVYYLLSGGSRTTTLMRVAASGGTPEELYYGVNTTRFDPAPSDGRIAVVDDAFPEERTQGSRLFLIDADGTNERTVIPRDGAYYYQPTWTPDGRSIAVRRQSNPNSDTSTLVLVDPGNGNQRTVGTLPGGSTYSFSPDGAWLVYATPTAGELVLVNLDNPAERRTIGAGLTPSWRPSASRTFPETGFTVSGRFLDYWESHGGLAINGFPLTEEREEVLEDGKTYRVQWFERVRLEYHPENPAPYDILLGQFGRRIHGGADPPVAPIDGARYFAETGHNLSGEFRAFWEGAPSGSGGLPQFGFPLTEVFREQLENGQTYEVQYFERARFEYHPENPAAFRVLLGQFGRRILAESTP